MSALQTLLNDYPVRGHSLQKEFLSLYKPKKFEYPKLASHTFSESFGTLEYEDFLKIYTMVDGVEIGLVFQQVPNKRTVSLTASDLVDRWNENPVENWNGLISILLEREKEAAESDKSEAEKRLKKVNKKLAKFDSIAKV